MINKGWEEDALHHANCGAWCDWHPFYLPEILTQIEVLEFSVAEAKEELRHYKSKNFITSGPSKLDEIAEPMKRQLDHCRSQCAKMRAALITIARSAPCKDGHESFNSPGQLCDQRIAENALREDGE